MKISEAIRLGSMLAGDQIFGATYYRDGSGVIIGACAIGAAELAGHELSSDEYWTECPICRLMRSNLPVAAIHLNDYHQWTREQIADWIEQVEPKEMSPTCDCTVPEECIA